MKDGKTVSGFPRLYVTYNTFVIARCIFNFFSFQKLSVCNQKSFIIFWMKKVTKSFSVVFLTPVLCP